MHVFFVFLIFFFECASIPMKPTLEFLWDLRTDLTALFSEIERGKKWEIHWAVLRSRKSP